MLGGGPELRMGEEDPIKEGKGLCWLSAPGDIVTEVEKADGMGMSADWKPRCRSARAPLITIINCSEIHARCVGCCGPVNGCNSVLLSKSRLCHRDHLQEFPELPTP